MDTPQNKYVLPLAIGAIIILIGAYFLFQGSGNTSLAPETATTTGENIATTTTTTPSAPGTAPSTGASAPAGTHTNGTIEVGQATDFRMAFNMTGLHVGSSISPFTMTLPEGSDNKYLVLTLKPVSESTVSGVLIGTAVHPTNSTYAIQGLTLSTVTNPATGAKTTITPGTYKIEAILWDHSPFGTGGYTNVAGNSAEATLSTAFTIAP